jgi:hypothetical protein
MANKALMIDKPKSYHLSRVDPRSRTSDLNALRTDGENEAKIHRAKSRFYAASLALHIDREHSITVNANVVFSVI